jgi:hypothetical protein
MTDERVVPDEIEAIVARVLRPHGVEPLHLDPSRVPPTLRTFVPEAARLGITDDGYRAVLAEHLPAVYAADLLERLWSSDELEPWLFGDGGTTDSLAYVAFSALIELLDRVMQFERARRGRG